MTENLQTLDQDKPEDLENAENSQILDDANSQSSLLEEKTWWQTCLAFIGPGHLVAVGYCDPGNWSTDLAASQFGYALLFIILMSSICAIFVQILALRLGICSGYDLAEICKERWKSPWIVWPLYILAEVAIIATDLAEVLGTAIALNLLFGLPLQWGVLITAADTLLLLTGLQNFEWILEWIVVAFVTTILGAFLYMMAVSPVDWSMVGWGYLPSGVIFTDSTAILIACGIVGATVMPHNLYLHSSLARDHSKGHSRSKAVIYSTWDVCLTLPIAFVINSAILIVAASNFDGREVTTIQEAYTLLKDLAGPAFAIVFAVALLISGQSSTITGTMAGQIVAEGYINWTMKPWIRRLITRLLAIVPALTVVLVIGESGLNKLLVASQVVLSMQLPFAVFPLVYFTSKRDVMGDWVNSKVVMVLGYIVTGVLVGMNVFLLVKVFGG